MNWLSHLLTPRPSLTLGTLANGLPFWPAHRLTLNDAESRYHAMVLGQSGSGKSKMIVNLFLQRVRNKQGSAIIEPHHDLSVECISHLIASGYYRSNPSAFEDVIYLDWGNGAYVPWNLLDKQGRAIEDETIGSNIHEAFVRVWPELAEAPNFETLVCSGVSVLIANDLPFTCFQRVIRDKEFRRRCLQKVSNPAVQTFFAWYDSYGSGRGGEAAQAEVIASTMKRIFRLEYQPATWLTFGQRTCAIDFRTLMDEGKSIIVNLGNVDNPSAKRVIGAMLLKQIQQAALSRREIQPESRRKHFVTFVDEFQLFAGQDTSIQEMLSQARKFRLSLYLATQTLTNVSLEGMRASMENCKLKITYGLGHGSAAIQAREIGVIDPLAVKEEPLTEHQHALFLGVQDQLVTWENEFKALGPQYCYVKVGAKPPVKVKTTTIKEPKVDDREAERVFTTYRRKYQKSRAEAEREALTSENVTRSPLPATDPSSAPPVPPTFKRPFNPLRADKQMD